MTEKNALLIAQLKQVRKEKGYSYQYICDESVRLGQSVSLSAVKRVFAEGSEEMGFRYSTLKPIASVVLDLDEDTANKTASPDEADALRNIISIKDTQLEELQRIVAEKSAEIVRLNKIIDRLIEK